MEWHLGDMHRAGTVVDSGGRSTVATYICNYILVRRRIVPPEIAANV